MTTLNTTTPDAKTPLTPQRIMQYAWGYSIPLIIKAAIDNRAFDILDAGPKTAEQIAKDSGASARGLAAILNMLVSVELVAKSSDGRYSLTPESQTFLVSTKPSFQGGIFKHLSTQLIPKWLQISDVVKTGKPAIAVNEQGDGAAFFEQFVEDIFPMSYLAAKGLGESLKLAAATTPVRVLDLATGSGVWGIALAQQSQRVTVTAVDWPGVLPVTKRVATRFGVGERFTLVAGDLLEAAFGTGHTVATLGHILHSEGAERSKLLLKKTFDALAPGGTIAIAEFVANDTRTGPPAAMIFAVNMLVHTEQGDTFTLPEMTAWLTTAGFKNVRTLEGPGPSPLILATKPG
jgi:ubiquinone/menaquinone biosynthesis C-methylase UbiE